MLVCGLVGAHHVHLTQACLVYDKSGKKIGEYHGAAKKTLPADAHTQIRTGKKEDEEWPVVFMDKDKFPGLSIA